MEYTQEALQEMIQVIEPEVLEQEPVYAGFRSLKRMYRLPETQITETIEYVYPASSDEWAAIRQIALKATHNA